MSSESVEEYLEAIYSFNERGELAKNSDLSKKLQVSPPSVTQMVKRLEEDGLVQHEPYKGTMLTGKGMALAQKVVRKHRLLERFLHDFLGLNRDKVHDEACRLEHSLSDEAAAALCEKMEMPETCPDDGNPIPPCPMKTEECTERCAARDDGSFKLLTQLSNLKPGEEGEVAFVRGGRRARQRIMDMGLSAGTNVKVVNAAPFMGPIEVAVRDTSLALGRRLASHVYVEMNDIGKPWERKHPHGPHHRRRHASRHK